MNEKISKILKSIYSLIICSRTLLLGSDDGWFLVLDPSSLANDRNTRSILRMQRLDGRDLFARRYERELRAQAHGGWIRDVMRIVNPLNMLRFLIYSLSDIF